MLRQTLCLTALSFVVMTVAALAAEAEQTYKGFEMRGRGDFAARCGAQTCAVGCRYFGADDGAGLVACAPDWKIYSLNYRKKLYIPLADFKGKNQIALAHAGVFGTAKGVKWEVAADTKFLGHRAHTWRRYIIPKSTLKNAPVDYWEFIGLDDLPIPQSFADFGTDFHQYPNVKYCCARMQHVRTNSKTEIYSDVYNIVAKSFPKSQFMVPKNFKRANNIFEVSMEMEGMDDVLQDFKP